MDIEKIAKELMETAKSITAATEVPLQEVMAVDPWVKKLLRSLSSLHPTFKGEPMVFSGIHGNVLVFKATILRFKPDQLKKLGSLDKVRWVEFGKHGVHIGIEGTWID